MGATKDTQSEPGPKRHHYVPRMMQKRFLNQRSRLHCVRRENPGRIFEVGPDQIFAETHLYAMIESDNSKDLSLESYYSELEGSVDPVFQQICEAAQPGMRLGWDGGVKSLVAEFVYNQLRRCPDYHRQVTPTQALQSELHQKVSTLAVEFPARASEFMRLLDEQNMPRMIHNVRVGALSIRPNKVLAVFEQMSICVICIGAANKSFILGSMPVARLGADALEHKACEIWMPISSKVAVGFIWGSPHNGHVVSIDADGVRRLNLVIAQQSSSFAASSPELIRSLLKPA